MMQIKIRSILIAASGTTLIFGLPQPSDVQLYQLANTDDTSSNITTKIDAPTQVCIYMCTDPNWQGTCQHLCSTPGSPCSR